MSERLDKLIADLSAKSLLLRMSAIRQLGHMGAEAEPALKELKKVAEGDGNQRFRREAHDAMIQIAGRDHPDLPEDPSLFR